MNNTEIVSSASTTPESWRTNSSDDGAALKTFIDSVTQATPTASSTGATEDVVRRLASEVESADGLSVSAPFTAIMVVSAFVFLTVFSVIAYVMRVRYRHRVASWHQPEEDGIQLQPILRTA